jgi:hypothetical protein
MKGKNCLKQQKNNKSMGKFLLLVVTSLFLFASISSVCAVVEVSKTIEVTSTGAIKADIVLRNDGSATIPKFLVEIQPRSGTCGLGGLSWISSQDTCNPKYPQNVHVFVNDMKPGETATVALITPPMPDGKYCVVGLTVDKCCVDANGNPVSPDCVATNPYFFGSELKWITVDMGIPQECSDGYCTGTENPISCPQDCKGYCGDGYCQPGIGETADWCGDCIPGGGGLGDIILWLTNNWWIVLAASFITIGAVVMIIPRRKKK